MKKRLISWMFIVALLFPIVAHAQGGFSPFGTPINRFDPTIPGEIGGTTPNRITATDLYLFGPDITHGMTSIAPTGDYAAGFQIGSSGGLDLYGMTEANQDGALRLTGIIGATDPTDSYSALILRGGKKNGTGWQALGDAETVFSLYNYTTLLGRAYGNGEWILSSLQSTPIGSTIASSGNFTSLASRGLATKAPAALTTFAGTVSSSGATVTFSSAADAALAGYAATNPTLGFTLIASAQTRYITAWTNSTTCTVDTAPSPVWAAGTAITSVQGPEAVFTTSTGVLSNLFKANGSAYFTGNMGLGTITNPGYKLDILSTTANDRGVNSLITATTGTNYGGVFTASGTGATANYGLYVTATGGTNNYGVRVNGIAANANNYSIYADAAAQNYFAGNVSIGTITPTQKFSVFGGNSSIHDNTILDTEALTNGVLTAGTDWTQTNDCALAADAATWTFSAGTASTLSQAAATLVMPGVKTRIYKFVYTVSGITGTPSASITTAFASASTALTLTAGTQTTYFVSAATPGAFTITSTLIAGQAFTLDTLSLKEITGGDIYTGGGLILGPRIIPPGTTGNQTMNRYAGRVNIAALGTSVTVTNDKVTANSIVIAVAATADATGYVKNVVPGPGSFVINCVGVTAETAFNWIVMN